MGKVMIAFCDTDDVYVRRFASFFHRSKGNLAELMIFSDRMIFENDTGKNMCQIWVLGEGFHSCAELAGEKNQVMLLGDVCRTEDGAVRIGKYQEAQEVIRHILSNGFVFQEKVSDFILTDIPLKQEVIGVTAPAGHRLLMPFSVALAEYLSRKKRVLYVNLSDCSGLSEWLQVKLEHDVTDLLYLCMKEERFSLQQIQRAVFRENGVDYLAEAENPMLLYEADERMYLGLLSGLLSDNSYDAIVLEMGIMHQGYFALLHCCGTIFCLRETDNLGKYRMNAFRRLCEVQEQNLSEEEGIYSRLREVEFDVPEELQDEELRMSCKAGFLQAVAKQAYERSCG